MLPSYATFKDEIEQIEKYMQSVYYYNQIITLDVTKSKAPYKDKIIDLQNCNDGFYKRKYDYAIAIISLYGCFEQFIENFVKDYLILLVDECKEYKELPEVILSRHIDLSISLLGRLDQTKYSGILSKEQIIKNLNDCIEHNKCILNYEAFYQHTANFRIQMIGEVLSNIGWADLVNSIKRNDELKTLYMEENGDCNYDNLELEKVFSFLNDLAERRNRIAHGTIDDILSFDLQMLMIKKVNIFVQEMDKLGFERVLHYIANKSYKIDEIYNPDRKTKLLCFKYKGNRIRVGDIIIKKSDDKFTYCRIANIEVEHIAYDEYVTLKETNIGIMLDTSRKIGEEYWLYSSISE